MHMRRHKWLPRLAAGLCAVLLLSGLPASASVPYNSYVYDRYSRPTPAPDAYVPVGTIDGQMLGVGAFNAPQDIFKDAAGRLYVADTGNNRIVALAADRKSAKALSTFRNGDKTETLNAPRNVFVTANGIYYIADTGNKRVLVADGDGNVLRILGKPDSDLFGANTEFKPRDLVVTSAGTVYVLVEGVYQGAVIFSPDGEFAGFYGSNKVEVSLSLLADFFWKNFMTSAQKSRMRRYVPVQYSSIQIDSEDFVYLTTEAASSPSERVRKLNPLGQNILRSSSNDKLFFGDTGTFQLQGETYETALTAIDVIDGKYITVLDRSRSRIFQYNQECDLLTVFGCSGSLEGAFTEPVGLCGVGNNVFVLDAQRNAITVFELTPYGETLHTAIDIYTDGRYQDSLPYWYEILKHNSLSVLANRGIGKALYQVGESEKAVEYFEKCNDTDGYSSAYGDIRKAGIRANFYAIALGLALLIVAGWLCKKFRVFPRLLRRIRERRKGA